jgi:hypothetical protein
MGHAANLNVMDVEIEIDETLEDGAGRRGNAVMEVDEVLDEPVIDRSPRVEGPLEIELSTRSGTRRFQVRDLSLTGIYLAGLTAPVGREVPLTIPLPGEAPLDVAARVVRCDRAPSPGVGLTFSRIGWDDLLSLARYLAPRL